MNTRRSVYMDHSATTPLRPEVLEAMLPYLSERYGNPSSVHSRGRQAKQGLEEARARVAALIGARPEEIVFTSGGTEANNLALLGAVRAYSRRGRHIITSAIEHHAVLDTAGYLRENGFEVTFLPVTADGLVRVEDVAAAVTEQTVLISIMHANNEIGTIQPIAEIGRLARQRGILFHTDAVQSAGKIPIVVDELGVDLLALSAHKFGGPKGTGALYVRKGVRLEPLLHGGDQERRRRPGTENLPGIVGMGAAAELAQRELPAEAARLGALRDRLIEGLLGNVPETMLTGHRQRRLPNHASFCLRGATSAALLAELDRAEVAASGGSACTALAPDPSHVLVALGLEPEWAQGALRLSLGWGNTEDDVAYVLEILPSIVERVRRSPPPWSGRVS
ncbi:MAG: cysteine desulfurase family protein [Clostridia bacterium]|nr:cysteine desulfurase [Clostridia bacterium]MDH7572791.1 cysteine desulfurase family protein [Clostridia bacterium]